MTGTRKFVFSLGMLSLVFLQACEKKKASLPPKMQAPTVAVVLPDEIPLAQVPQEPTPQAEPAKPATSQPNVRPKKPARKPSSSAKKTNVQNSPSSPPAAQPPAPAGQTVASLQPPRTAPAEALPETVVGAAVSNAQVAQLKEETARMIESTENTLKGLNRSLSDNEKSMRSQIQSYLQQSRKATTDGDYERASLLAKKAQLLAEALVKK